MNKQSQMSSTHRKRHEQLHKALDELIDDFRAQTDKLPCNVTLVQFHNWSYDQIHAQTQGETENE